MENKIPPQINNPEQPIPIEKDIILSVHQEAVRTADRRGLLAAANLREYPYLQFDNMAYSRQYFENEKVGMNFIRPKRNKAETPFTSGITANKIRTIGSMINGYNFEPVFTVKHKGAILDELSVIFTEWVRDSRAKEKYNEKMRIQNRSLFEQGTAYTIEHYVNNTTYEKDLLSPYIDVTKLDTVRYAKGKKKIWGMPQCDHLRGTKVFLGNMKENNIDRQEIVYIVEFSPYAQLKSAFGMLENFQYVKEGKGAPSMLQQLYIQNPYHLDNVEAMVKENEVVTVIDPINNRYQIYISTIPMFPEDFPLTVVSPSGKINIAKGDLNPSEDFAISRGIPFDTKIDQQMYDLTVKIMFIKMKQAAYTPTVNNTGKFLSSAIYEPGMMSEGFKAQDIEKLIDSPGITNADFSWAQMLNQSIDEKSLRSILEGQVTDASTLGEYLDRSKKAMVTIGYIFDAICNWEQQKSLLRLYNLIAYGVSKKADDDTQYQELFIGSDKDQWNISFNDDTVITEEEKIKREKAMFKKDLEAKDKGTDTKHATISIKNLRKLINDPDFIIEVDVVPVDKNNDSLAQIKFINKLTTAQKLFGPQDLATDRLKKQYARFFNDSYTDIFKSPEELELELMQAQQQMADSMGAQLQSGQANPQDQMKQAQEKGAPKAPAPNPMVDGFFR